MSPVLRAVRTSTSGTSSPRCTRISYGLLASRLTCSAEAVAILSSVEGAIDDVHLLLAGQPHEVHRVARHSDRQARIFLRMIHCIDQRLAVQHVDIHVIAGRAEEAVEDG